MPIMDVQMKPIWSFPKKLRDHALGPPALQTGPVETAADVQGEMPHGLQGRHRTRGMLGSPHRLPAEGARTPKRLEGAGGCGRRTRRRPCPGKSFPVRASPLYQARTTNVE